jgi:ankyrin repeat protein
VRRAASASAGGAAEPPPRLPCRYTPLHYAAKTGRSDAIAELLMRGAAVNIQDKTK